MTQMGFGVLDGEDKVVWGGMAGVVLGSGGDLLALRGAYGET